MTRWKELESEFPGLTAAAALVSCEEAVVDVQGYAARGPTRRAEKEHVMVAVAIVVDGRRGVLLADPGYHVPRVITVMADRGYPHTGWFTQSDEPHCHKEYNYKYNPQNCNYVEWHEKEIRGAEVKCQTSLIYTRPYLDGINVTERRNLVYNFRSLLARDQKGHLVAGLYFPVGARGKDAQFTLFRDNAAGEQTRTKWKFSMFLTPEKILPKILEEIELCNTKMNYEEGQLLNIIIQLANLMMDQPFIDQLLEINENICRMSL